MMRFAPAFLGVLLLVSSAPAFAEKPADISLDRIRVQFLYETSGTLSEDVTPPSQFSIWNTIIGEGSAHEPASDVMVGVVLKSSEAEANLDRPVTLTVKNDKGKVLVTRRFERLFLKNHQVVRYVLVPDAVRAGDLAIDAAYGNQKKTAKVSMSCGE